ncbi:hypothetical protein BC629DRAFT_961396 [Irpex lacteus]|nr:hypothetical protein BC629DRAFT_961396 [Irpex lacteus]
MVIARVTVRSNMEISMMVCIMMYMPMQQNPTKMLCRVVLIMLVAFACLLGVAAQTTNITCPSEYGWMTNSKWQNPCLVAAYLQSVCDSDPAISGVQTLPPGHHYILRAPNASNCTCNTVLYSMLSACTICQAQEYLPWSGWSENCTYKFVGNYPKPIPQGTAVPAWAYENVTLLDTFNITTAERIARENHTDSTALPTPTAVSSPNDASPTQISTTKRNKLTPILSGVFGALILILVAAATTFLWKRQRKIKRIIMSKPDGPSTQMHNVVRAESMYEHEKATPTRARFYNPEDPTTFPSQTSLNHHDARTFQPIRYAGHAEL